MRFTKEEYDEIYSLTFDTPGYAGYRPSVQEAPNGDGKWDEEKRYAHVATKYKPCSRLVEYYKAGFEEACRVSRDLAFPHHLWPSWENSCMRILDYPPGAESAEHTDFDLFTIQLYRDQPEGFVRTGTVDQADESISTGIHFGEMAEVALLRKAMPHKVVSLPVRQKSIVFFVIPSPDSSLITAGDWLKERYARSRR
jgi:hypothetical protein